MKSLLRRLSGMLSEWRDSVVVVKDTDGGYRHVVRKGRLPLTTETLTRYVIVDMPTDVIRALLAAYQVRIDPAALNVVSPGRSHDSTDISTAALEIVTRAYVMGKSSRGSRNVDP